jgi:hypothetical protein
MQLRFEPGVLEALDVRPGKFLRIASRIERPDKKNRRGAFRRQRALFRRIHNRRMDKPARA